jgi:enamine deaminase RidA (YjgF/YER057c/UK114 family)
MVDYFGTGKSSSEATIHDQIVYLSPQVATKFPATIGEQTSQILAQIDQCLERCGTSKRKLLSATIYCADARFFSEVDAVWDAWVPWHDPPATTQLVVKLQSSQCKVAIGVVGGL